MSTRPADSRIPRTDLALADPRLAAARRRLGDRIVKGAIHAVQATTWASGGPVDDFVGEVLSGLPEYATSLTPILNATGVLLHTNIGRAPLSAAAGEALTAAMGYADVEYDLLAGRRTGRGTAVRDELVRAVPPAQDALVVNNGAAALVLTAVALAPQREVVISRGEMVEIGGSFRIAEIIASTGAHVREVGSTNRTRLTDYRAAIGADTGFVLKVHPSNFSVHGFVSEVPVTQLATLPVPLVADVGSGLLGPDPALPHEPDASTWLSAGADLVIGSGDKLLGGPQSGIILGNSELIDKLRRHPMARAMRVGKLTLAALEATLSGPPPPIHEMLHCVPEVLRGRTQEFHQRLVEREIPARMIPSSGVVGGGSASAVRLPGWAIEIPLAFAKILRIGRPSVVGRIEGGQCLIDLRCVPTNQDPHLLEAIQSAANVIAASAGANTGEA
ncbi:MAG: L-seryl-tRNA(Sec) selenium transferase [Nakamurella sp.]